MLTTLKLCTVCGEPTPNTRCKEHSTDKQRPSFTQRGYDSQWRALSTQARRLQPWCSDCGATTRLTADHSPAAWELKAQGKPIPLELIDVVCVPCNNRRGPARGFYVTRTD